MMNVLSEDIIKNTILPHLRTTKKETKGPTGKLISSVQIILYRLKAGYQVAHAPISSFVNQDYSYSWKSVFHHFNKWSKQGAWLEAWGRYGKWQHGSFRFKQCSDGWFTHTSQKRWGVSRLSGPEVSQYPAVPALEFPARKSYFH
jgi:hypothetical protein